MKKEEIGIAPYEFRDILRSKRIDILMVVEEIRRELQPVIEHLLDIDHTIAANHLLTIRDSLLKKLETVLEG